MIIVKVVEYHLEKRKKNDYYDNHYGELVGTWDDMTCEYEHKEEIEMAS